MKRLLLFLMLFLTLSLLNSCSKPSADSKGETAVSLSEIYEPVTQYYFFKPKWSFKHSGGPSQCSGCQCPLGLCRTFGAKNIMITAEEEVEGGYGYVQAGIVNDQLHLIFEQPVAVWDATNSEYIIPIVGDFFLDDIVSANLGYETVEVQDGNYVVSFDNYPDYGEVFLDVVTTNFDVPNWYPRIKVQFGNNSTELGGLCNSSAISTGSLSWQEYNTNYGQIQVGIHSSDELHFIFERPSGDSEDMFIVCDNYLINAEISDLIGATSITILEGEYEIDYSQHTTYGEAYIDASITY